MTVTQGTMKGSSATLVPVKGIFSINLNIFDCLVYYLRNLQFAVLFGHPLDLYIGQPLKSVSKLPFKQSVFSYKRINYLK